jgi:PAS domain S-box-containing protein
MSDDRIPYDELRERLERAEATLSALRREEVDLDIGTTEPLVIHSKSLVQGNERLPGSYRSAAEDWQRTFDAMLHTVWVLDQEHRILRSNSAAERMFERPHEAFIGKHCWEIVHCSDQPIPECPLLKAKRSLCRETLDIRIDEGWFKVRVDPILDPGDGYAGAVHIIEDITKLRLAEEKREALAAQLQQTRKMEAIGVLAGGVAHDFNNLLTTILGCAELALAELGKGEPLYEDITEIKKAGEKAEDLTRQLLAFSRKEIREPELLDLNGTLEEMKKMLRRLIREDIELVVIPEPGLWQVYLDPGQMDQIIMNLVVNARDAMPDCGTLTLETANVALDRVYFRNHGIDNAPGPYVMLAVTDTGIGMDQDVQTKMFDPFFTTKNRSTGTGLGLATLYGIIKQNRGYVWSYSEPGQGTTMKVYLPKAEDTLEPGHREEAHEGGLTGTETVLVVEDNDPVRDTTLKILDQFGYRTLAARDGEEAVRVSRDFEGEIHLLLTDVIMPGMSGKELSESLQSMRPEMKVLYMSGYTENVIMQKGLLPADIHYIQKPFSLKALASKVRETIQMQSG